MTKNILLHRYIKHYFNFISTMLMCVVLMLPLLCLAGVDDTQFMANNTLVSPLDVKGTTGTAHWSSSSPTTSKEKIKEISINNNAGLSWLPESGLNIMNNCVFNYTTDDNKSSTIIISLNQVKSQLRYKLSEPAIIVFYEISCKAILTNVSDRNIVMDNLFVFYVNFHFGTSSSQFILNAAISTGTLYTTPSCTLSVPNSSINFSGDAASFINGIRRSASFSATCEGTSDATLSLSGVLGDISAEGCLSVPKQGDVSQKLKLCAVGFGFDGLTSKAINMDGSGNNTGSIDFTLSSFNNEKPQPGDYNATVYAIIAPD